MNTLIPPLKPTWRRYFRTFFRKANISIYRSFEYEELSRIDYSGRILDFGGGNKAHYLSQLRSWMGTGKYESVNIAETMEPTYLIHPGDKIPVAADSFDMVLSVNTLEHVLDLDNVLSELVRVLKPGGQIVLAVPFLYRIHGCPNDYNRPTASWWCETLPKYGMRDLKIRPLVWDVMTSGLSITEGAGPFSRLRKMLVPLYGLLYAAVRARGPGERYPECIGDNLANVALGYVITGVKS
jgi:SAM-dependent methyltransferase